MKATQVLRDEHQGILAMLNVVETAVYRLQKGESLPPDLMVNAAGFFRNFADECHHGKEEDELFPAMQKRGVAKQGGPIGAMLAEHDQGRAYVRAMAEAAGRYAKGDATAVPSLIKSTLGYVGLLRQHIAKENQILFEMADRVLPESEQSRLYDAFERIEANKMGRGVHERYHAMIGEYEQLAAGWQR